MEPFSATLAEEDNQGKRNACVWREASIGGAGEK